MADLLWTAWFYRKQYQVASVEVYSYLAFRWAELLCQFLKLIKKPYVLTLHGGKLAEFAEENPKRVQRLLLSAEVVTTPSKFLHSVFSTIRHDINYIPNGIYLSTYPNELRKQPKPSLIWMRSLHHIYNPTLAIKVLKSTHDSFPDAGLTMIGPDKEEGIFEDLNSLVQSMGLQESVHFTGAIPKEKVGQYLSKGDVFLNTTNYESFGVSMLEAAACGLCIVTTNAGELPYLWEDGVDVLIVPKDDPELMATAVRRILKEPGLAEKLSRNARAKAEKYDWSVIMPRWEALFNNVIGYG
jgi:glycosyltransferase involved in cell wall biosynthesis